MKELLNKFFRNWNFTIIFWIIGCSLLALTLIFENKYFYSIAFITFGIGILMLLFSSIHQLSKKTGLLEYSVYPSLEFQLQDLFFMV